MLLFHNFFLPIMFLIPAIVYILEDMLHLYATHVLKCIINKFRFIIYIIYNIP